MFRVPGQLVKGDATVTVGAVLDVVMDAAANFRILGIVVSIKLHVSQNAHRHAIFRDVGSAP